VDDHGKPHIDIKRGNPVVSKTAIIQLPDGECGASFGVWHHSISRQVRSAGR
jgi:hypothetical protein